MSGCNPSDLAVRALGRLDEPSTTAVDHHLGGCATCRAELADLRDAVAVLGFVPPEVLIDGPPDADLVLQRAIRQTRRESRSALRRRSRHLLAAAAVVVALAAGGGVLAGQSAPQRAAEPLLAAPQAAPPKPAARTIAATDSASGARMTVTLTPASGWVRLSARVAHIPAGERCTLVVVGRDGSRTIAGSWVVPPSADRAGTQVAGSAAVALDAVVAVEVQNEQQRRFVTAAV